MARIDHPGGDFLAASSVFPWRGAARFWPAEDGATFAERCAAILKAHAEEIEKAGRDLPVVWGGDFNQALSGLERALEGAGGRHSAPVSLNPRVVPKPGCISVL